MTLPVLHVRLRTIHTLQFLSSVDRIRVFIALIFSLFQVCDSLVPSFMLFFLFVIRQFFTFQLSLVLSSSEHEKFDLELFLSVSFLNPTVKQLIDQVGF